MNIAEHVSCAFKARLIFLRRTDVTFMFAKEMIQFFSTELIALYFQTDMKVQALC